MTDEQKLLTDFPTVFRDYGGDPTVTCMAWGFECSSGWFQIIYDLCEKASKLPGFEDFVAEQVKEKFGGLRFYCSANEEIYKLVREAEELSYKTCEQCGSMEDVELRGKGWVSTMCGSCYENCQTH